MLNIPVWGRIRAPALSSENITVGPQPGICASGAWLTAAQVFGQRAISALSGWPFSHRNKALQSRLSTRAALVSSRTSPSPDWM